MSGYSYLVISLVVMNILLPPVSKEHIKSSLLRQEVEIPVEFQLKSFSKCLESDLKIRRDMRKQSGLISKLSGAEPNQNSSLQFYEASTCNESINHVDSRDVNVSSPEIFLYF